MAKVFLAQTGGKGKKLVLKIDVSATGLPDADNVVGLWREDTNEIVGHTDVVKGAAPSFATELHLDHYMSADLPVKFCVYSVTKDPIDESCFVGSYVTTLSNLFKKKNQEQAMETGTLVLKTTVLADPNAPKKEKKAPKEQPKKMTAAEKAAEKAKKACLKEGGKKGQDLCGMSTFGVHHFLTSIDSGIDWPSMELVMQGMNKEVDPEADDRKGGAGDLAKILFTATDEKLIIYCNVPKEQKAAHPEVTAEAFLKAVAEPIKAKIFDVEEFFAKAEIDADPDNNKYPLKLKDEAIAQGFAFLRSHSLILDDDSDDEINFADECGVDLNAGANDEDY